MSTHFEAPSIEEESYLQPDIEKMSRIHEIILRPVVSRQDSKLSHCQSPWASVVTTNDKRLM